MRTQSTLYGNGLNLLNEGTLTWDDLLKDIAKDRLDSNIPNTLKYEAVILKQPYREALRLVTEDDKYLLTSDGKMLYVPGDQTELKLKRDIAQRVSKFEPNEFYRILADLPVEHFMTTNYDNTLLKVKGERTIKSIYRREQTYSIRRYYTLSGEHCEQYYWPIHGNAESPKSIMLGFDHYCGALSKVENYVKGAYDSPDNGRVSSMIKRLQDGIEKPISWIDLFFISDVHIIGQGLAYEEMDLWWILNKRRRINQKEEGLIKNKIVYYPDSEISEDKKQLLRGFDVEINELPDYSAGYHSNYRAQLELMKERMLRVD